MLPASGQLLEMGSHLLLLAPPPAQMIRKDPVLEAYQQEITYVFHALRWLGARPQEIEDLAQEVFIALRRAWPRYDSSRPLRPYLFGVAFRVVSMQRRKTKREVAFGRLEISDGAPHPDEVLQAKQARAMVLRALERIPLRRRAVLVMHDLEEVPMGQVAATLSVPLFTAYSRLRKARTELETAIRRLAKDVSKR
jgi:RNA polymerase sigma-70 factor (ECF subfamily)